MNRGPRVAVRDGQVVLLKVCMDCGEEKVCGEAGTGIGPKSRWPDGEVRTWNARCRKCDAAKQRQYREGRPAELAKREKERRAAKHRERMANDPEYVERRRRTARAVAARARQDPETAEVLRERSKRYHRERKKREPEKVNEEHRMYYALRQERQGKKLRLASTRRPEQPAAPRVPAGPFKAWLQAYGAATGLRSGQAIAEDLSILDRRVVAVLGDEHERVALDIVDAALIAARTEVEVEGVLVFTLTDLYPAV